MKLGSLIRDKASGLIKSSMKEELGEILHRSKKEDHMSEHRTDGMVGMDLTTTSPRSSSGERTLIIDLYVYFVVCL
jgi:hypothetical protein